MLKEKYISKIEQMADENEMKNLFNLVGGKASMNLMLEKFEVC
ncbi:hypothetical protein RDI58_024919 [Solanum bulbocastanum]|uniref:Uncharacterized protein n=1 Tax=Solanum bulbocastanum TaxID=147425 RepID=A0AAN8T446_SOLBU